MATAPAAFIWIGSGSNGGYTTLENFNSTAKQYGITATGNMTWVKGLVEVELVAKKDIETVGGQVIKAGEKFKALVTSPKVSVKQMNYSNKDTIVFEDMTNALIIRTPLDVLPSIASPGWTSLSRGVGYYVDINVFQQLSSDGGMPTPTPGQNVG